MNKVARNHNIFNTCLCGLILLWLCSVHVRTIKAEGNQFHYSKGHYSIHDSERQADQEMYECKKRMKVTRE